jgi:transmembrane sensor
MKLRAYNRKHRGDQRFAHVASIREQAALWTHLLHQRPDDAGLRRDFERWCAASDAHRQAAERMRRIHELVLSTARSERMLTLYNRSLTRTAARQRRRRRRWRYALSGIAAALVLGLAGLFAAGGNWQDLRYLPEYARYALTGDTLYRTAVGERFSIALPDRSRMTLNTASRAVVRYRQGERGVRLLDGQALFEVERAAGRPFVVTAGERRITALGTAFDVRLSGDSLQVLLLEGRVSVDAKDLVTAASGPPPVRTELEPGERLVVAAAKAAPVIEKTNVERATSWLHGQAIFQNDPLAAVVAEMSRYGDRRIELTDDEILRGMRVSGAFHTGNTESFVATLTSLYDVRVVDTNRRRILIAPR